MPDDQKKDTTMTTLAKRAGTVGVTGALMLVAVGWAARRASRF